MEDSDLRPRGAQLQPAAPAQLPNPGAHKAQSDPRSHPSPPPPPPGSLSPVLFRRERCGLKQSVWMSNASPGGAVPRSAG